MGLCASVFNIIIANAIIVTQSTFFSIFWPPKFGFNSINLFAKHSVSLSICCASPGIRNVDMNFLNASSTYSFVKSKFSRYARITATPSASLDPSKCPIADGSTPGADRKNLAASDADTTELLGACSRRTAIVGVLLNFFTAISTDFFSFLRFANVFVCDGVAIDDDDDVVGTFSSGTEESNPPPMTPSDSLPGVVLVVLVVLVELFDSA